MNSEFLRIYSSFFHVIYNAVCNVHCAQSALYCNVKFVTSHVALQIRRPIATRSIPPSLLLKRLSILSSPPEFRWQIMNLRRSFKKCIKKLWNMMMMICQRVGLEIPGIRQMDKIDTIILPFVYSFWTAYTLLSLIHTAVFVHSPIWISYLTIRIIMINLYMVYYITCSITILIQSFWLLLMFWPWFY